MGDVLGVVGSAVGIVSLGLQVSQGLYDFVAAARSRGEDIRRLEQLTGSTKDTLKIIEKIVKPSSGSLKPDPDTVDEVKKKVDACDAAINNIISVVEKNSPATFDDGLRDKAKRMARVVIYPLRKKGIMELQGEVEGLYSKLQLLLQILTFDSVSQGNEIIVRKVEEQMTVVSSAISSSSERTIAALTAHSDATSLVHHTNTAILLEIRAKLEAMDPNTTQRLSQIHAVALTASSTADAAYFPVGPQSSPLPRPPHGHKRVPNRHKPWVNGHQATDMDICTCATRRETTVQPTRKYFRSFWLDAEESVVHEQACPLWYTSRRKRTYRVNFSAFGFVVYGPIEITNSPYFWVKGLRIDPKMSCRVVVPYNSPAFKLVRKYDKFVMDSRIGGSWDERKDSKAAFDLKRQLSILFQNGEASPFDVDERGCNLAHTLALWKRPIWDIAWYWVHVLEPLGVSWTEKNLRHRSAFQQAAINMYNNGPNLTLKEIALYEYEENWSEWPSLLGSNTLCAQVIIEDFACYCQCGPLSSAIIQNKRSEVETLLRSQPELGMTEKNILGQTPLHFAIFRPNLLKLMLSSGIHLQCLDAKDFSGNGALDYAMKHGLEASCLLFLHVGASYRLDSLRAIWWFSTSTMKLFAKAARSQLEDLHSLGCDHGLVRHMDLDINIASHGRMARILHELKINGVKVMIRITNCHRIKPFVHDTRITLEMLTCLFEEGLVDVNELFRGLSPMLIGYFGRPSDSRMCWLFRHGARINLYVEEEGGDTSPKAKFTVAHILAANLSTFYSTLALVNGNRARFELFIGSEGFGDLLQAVISHERPEANTCACTGRSSISLPFRSLRNMLEFAALEICEQLGLLDQHPTDSLRLLTFSALGLTHTCPDFDKNWPWPTFVSLAKDEIAEIREEEEEFLDTLESLLESFDQDYQEMKLPFLGFIEDIWLSRMKAELDETATEERELLQDIEAYLQLRKRGFWFDQKKIDWTHRMRSMRSHGFEEGIFEQPDEEDGTVVLLD